MSELTAKHYKALTCLASGMSTTEAALQCGISKSCIDKWKTRPDFKELLQEATFKVFEMGMAQLVLGVEEAGKELRRMISSPDTSDRNKLTAISILLSTTTKMKDWSIENRIAQLEEALDRGFSGESAIAGEALIEAAILPEDPE